MDEVVLEYARAIMGEPIPTPNESARKKIESSLATIQQYYYPDLITKAANLFYFICKNHAYENGNKRMAVIATLLFLMYNGKILDMPYATLAWYAEWVASSKSSDGLPKQKVVPILINALEKTCIDFDITSE